MSTRVIIFDDNAKRLEGLSLLINSMGTMECVGCYQDCREVLKKIADTRPDVVLMDINMPHVDGIEGVKIIRSQYPDLKILMQTVLEDDEKVFAAVCAGADGYILKQTPPIKLLDAIEEVMAGGAPMTPVIARKVLQFFGKKDLPPPVEESSGLTKREIEILNLLAKGYRYKMIAEELFISPATVATHVTSIYSKLKVQNVGGAISAGLKKGLVKDV